MTAIGTLFLVYLRESILQFRAVDRFRFLYNIPLEILVNLRLFLQPIFFYHLRVRTRLPEFLRLSGSLMQRIFKVAVRKRVQAFFQVLVRLGGSADGSGILPRRFRPFFLGTALVLERLFRFLRRLFLRFKRVVCRLPVLELLTACGSFISSYASNDRATDAADERAAARLYQRSRHSTRAGSDEHRVHRGLDAAVLGKRANIVQCFLDGFRIDADALHGICHAIQDIDGSTSKSVDHIGKLLDRFLVVLDAADEVLKAVYDGGHQILCYRQERRAEGELELPRFHLHLAPFEICLMRFFWIEQPRRLDVRGNFHKVVVLLQDWDERGSSCAEDFGSKGFLFACFCRASIAFGETFQLLVESEEIAALIRQRDAES